jgi:hypothetical protein
MSGGAIRAFWQFGSRDNPQDVTGMDFVVLNGGRVRRLYAFLDRDKN